MNAPAIETQQRRRYAPGWYKDLTNEEYHGSAGTSSSQLKKLIEKTPAHFKQSWSDPPMDSPSVRLGTAVHTLVLEPEKFDAEIAIEPMVNKRTNAGKAQLAEFEAENAGKTIISASQLHQAQHMAESVLADEFASLLLQDTVVESSIYWWYRTMDNDEIEAGEKFREMVKVRPDAISRTHSVVIDLKTAQDATHDGFALAAARFYYHVSAAMYLEGVNQCKPLLDELGHFAYNKFVFICVEPEPPYLCAVYELSQEALDLGRTIYRRMMRKLRDAREENFPGFPNEIRPLELPAWASRGFYV